MSDTKIGSITERIQMIIIIVSFISLVVATGYGFINWIDNRYARHGDLTENLAVIGITMYDHQIGALNSEKTLLLKQQLELSDEEEAIIHSLVLIRIKDLDSRLKRLHNNRRYFLETGHYLVGDSISLNRSAVRKLINN